MHDANVLPYGSDDERNGPALAMAEAELNGDMERYRRYAADLERMNLRYGDTPARRAGYGHDWDSAGVPVPPGARAVLDDSWAPIGHTSDGGAFVERDPSPHIGEAGAWSRPSRQLGTYAGED